MQITFKNKWRGVKRLSVPFFITILGITACKKQVTSVGINSIDPYEILESGEIDTFSLETTTYFEDSILTANPLYGLLGSYQDPVFGKVDASIYTQLTLPSANYNFGDFSSITVDSVVLGLAYRGQYGKNDPQTFEVYELADDLSIDSSYYSFTQINNKGVNLVKAGTEVITPDPDGITVVGSDTVETQLRIQLDNSFATDLFTEAENNPSTFSSYDNFKAHLKGLQIKANNTTQSDGEGSVYYFNLNSKSSAITIYYKESGEDKSYTIEIDASCADFNHVDIENTGTIVESGINTPSVGKSQFFAQALHCRASIAIPGLSNLSKKAVIHKATLYLPVENENGSHYEPGTELTLSTPLSSTSTQLVNIGVTGVYDDFFKYFKADIRSYTQAIVTNQLDNTYLLAYPKFFNTSSDRIIFNGPETDNKKKPKLVILYTTY